MKLSLGREGTQSLVPIIILLSTKTKQTLLIIDNFLIWKGSWKILDIFYTDDKEKYNDYINRILNSRENKKNEECYMERHHIIPRCIGGTNDEENLIYLFPYEHYYAHKKLAIENEDNIKLARAWWLMSHIKSNDFLKTISAEEYAEARILFSKKISEE